VEGEHIIYFDNYPTDKKVEFSGLIGKLVHIPQ
jgi:hypothetical protein